MTSSSTEPGHDDAVHDRAQDRLVETPDSLRDVDPEQIPTDRGLGPGDRPAGAERFGTTHAEAARGQDLDHRLAEEQPDIGALDAPDAREVEDEDDGDELPEIIGRLIAPDEGAHEDEESEAIGTDVGPDGGDLSAEEAAMHLERP